MPLAGPGSDPKGLFPLGEVHEPYGNRPAKLSPAAGGVNFKIKLILLHSHNTVFTTQGIDFSQAQPVFLPGRDFVAEHGALAPHQ